MTKRLLDCVGAGSALIVLAPLMLAIAVAIVLDSPGPVLFRHRRVGRAFRPFDVYKFRTMAAGRVQVGPSITFGGRADPRITRIGRILRDTKLDELPQLVNVLKGEMSLVGPRPEVDEYVALYRQEYETLLSVRPGLSDFASIAYRDEAAVLAQAADPAAEYAQRILPEKIRLSKQYVQHASIAVDLAVLGRTILTLLDRDRPQRLV